MIRDYVWIWLQKKTHRVKNTVYFYIIFVKGSEWVYLETALWKQQNGMCPNHLLTMYQFGRNSITLFMSMERANRAHNATDHPSLEQRDDDVLHPTKLTSLCLLLCRFFFPSLRHSAPRPTADNVNFWQKAHNYYTKMHMKGWPVRGLCYSTTISITIIYVEQ